MRVYRLLRRRLAETVSTQTKGPILRPGHHHHRCVAPIEEILALLIFSPPTVYSLFLIAIKHFPLSLPSYASKVSPLHNFD